MFFFGMLPPLYWSTCFQPQLSPCFFLHVTTSFWGQVGVHFSTDNPLIGMSLPLRTISNTKKRLVTFLCNFSPPPIFFCAHKTRQICAFTKTPSNGMFYQPIFSLKSSSVHCFFGNTTITIDSISTKKNQQYKKYVSSRRRWMAGIPAENGTNVVVTVHSRRGTRRGGPLET